MRLTRKISLKVVLVACLALGSGYVSSISASESSRVGQADEKSTIANGEKTGITPQVNVEFSIVACTPDIIGEHANLSDFSNSMHNIGVMSAVDEKLTSSGSNQIVNSSDELIAELPPISNADDSYVLGEFSTTAPTPPMRVAIKPQFKHIVSPSLVYVSHRKFTNFSSASTLYLN